MLVTEIFNSKYLNFNNTMKPFYDISEDEQQKSCKKPDAEMRFPQGN